MMATLKWILCAARILIAVVRERGEVRRARIAYAQAQWIITSRWARCNPRKAALLLDRLADLQLDYDSSDMLSTASFWFSYVKLDDPWLAR